MRTRKWTALAIAGGAAVALAGCGTVHAGQPAGTSSTASVTAAAPTPAQRAAADAVSLMAAFRPPPGAVRTGPLPVSWLARSPEVPGPSDLVTRTQWWRVAGHPQTVFAWINSHLPSGLTLAASGAGGLGPRIVFEPRLPHPGVNQNFLRLWFDEFSKPAVPGVLSTRWLVVSVAAYGTGQVAIRVDSEVVWQPAKPAAERIPAAAKVVTIAPVPGPGPVSAYAQPVTITDPAKVTKIAAVVDGLPLFPIGMMSCPMDRGGGMRLTFRAAPSGPVLAVVTGETSGCRTVAVTINGTEMRTLGQAGTMEKQVMSIAGLHWPGFPG